MEKRMFYETDKEIFIETCEKIIKSKDCEYAKVTCTECPFDKSNRTSEEMIYCINSAKAAKEFLEMVGARNNSKSQKRTDYIDWDTYFMGVAMLSGKRSKDPSTQVGACIVRDNKILSIGYNGFPSGCNDDEFPWRKDSCEWIDNKYPYVCHAELNAILNSNNNLEGATIYVNLFPCNECAKAIIQSGIKEIVYISDKDNGKDFNTASKRMLNAADIKIRKMEFYEITIS